jgi:tripartite-type tricarboxylate transporter receptor subunit TctC
VPIGTGSATDSLARQLAEALRAELKGDFIVENKTGAGGIIGTDAVAKAKPDGYTLGVFFSSVLTASPAVSSKLPYDPRKDFTPIAIVASNPIVLAVPTDSPYKSLDEFVTAAKKEPNKLTTGFIGIGSHSHFNLELLRIDGGADVNAVPFSGGMSPMLTALLGHQIDSGSALWAAFAPQVRGGKLRLLATATPLKEQPNVPTFGSKGFKRANMDVLSVVVGPAGMPPEVTATLARALEKIVADPKMAASVEKLGYVVTYGGPQRLAAHINEEITLLTQVARKADIKAE